MSEGCSSKYGGGSGMGCWQKASLIVALLSLAASVALLAVFFSAYQGLPQRVEEHEAAIRMQDTFFRDLSAKMEAQETLIRELSGKLEFHKMNLHRVQKEMQVILSQIKSESAREESLRRREEAAKIFTGEPSAPLEVMPEEVMPEEVMAAPSDEHVSSESSEGKPRESKKHKKTK